MVTESLWNAFAGKTDFPALTNAESADVVIIGAGITGLSAAQALAQKGLDVVVLEAGSVGKGTSSHSTGNLYCTIDKGLHSLQSKYDTNTISTLVDSRNFGLNIIEKNINEFGIDCDFKRQPWYLYTAPEHTSDRIKKELKTATEIGLQLTEISGNDFPYPAEKIIKLDNQAQFNPILYLQELARNIQSDNCRIYEHSHVKEVDEKDDFAIIQTDDAEINASFVIHATHTPKGIKFVHTLLGPYREYGIACKIEGEHPEGIYWGYIGEQDEKISTRIYHRNNESFLVVVGKPHKVGQAEDNIRHIQELEDFAKRHFNVQDITHRWGGQNYQPADQLPYIGKEKNDSRTYIATGFSTDGLVYGALAGSILSDMITGDENPWANLYSSTRNQPMKAAEKFLKENLNVAAQFLKYVPGSLDDEDLDEVTSGEGIVISKDGKKLAVYRDESGKLHICSAICTHMACIVSWNNAEKTWDCPCHASRFNIDGSVIEGPAYRPLK